MRNFNILVGVIAFLFLQNAFAQMSCSQAAQQILNTHTLAPVPSDGQCAGYVIQMNNIESQIQAKQKELYAAQNAGQGHQGDAQQATDQIASLTQQQAAVFANITNYEEQAVAAAGDTPSPCAPQEKAATTTCTLGLPAGAEPAIAAALAAGSQAMQSGGTEKMCKAGKELQMLMAGVNMGHAAMCGGAIGTCTKTCNAFVAKYDGMAASSMSPMLQAQIKAAKQSSASCSALENRVAASITSGVTNLMAMAVSSKCQKAVTTNASPSPTASPGDAMDCKNPMMASAAVCVCALNPHDPVCSASTQGGLGSGSFASDNGAGAGGALSGKDPESIKFADGIGKIEPTAGGAPPAGANAASGGAMNAGAGAQPLAPEDSGGPGKGPYNPDIMGGTTGGGGGGGGLFGSGGGGSGSGAGSLFGSLAEKFNLKGFLPNKGDFKNRGIASGGGADGITGPNGPSLFEKVSARYLKKQSELLP